MAAPTDSLRLILASASPRRQELIRLLGLPFTVYPADVDESQVDDPDPALNVVKTAELKAGTVAEQLARETPPAGEEQLIVAADTTVALAGEMLGKPATQGEAQRILRKLRGRVHHVHTGICLIRPATNHKITDVASVPVPMRLYSDQEIEAYLATGDPMDKAGAYAIQHPDFRPVSDLADCYAAVMGLPLCHLTRALRQIGFPLSVDIAARCQQHNQYDCPVYPQILT